VTEKKLYHMDQEALPGWSGVGGGVGRVGLCLGSAPNYLSSSD
jgi:hypothetical protein